MGKEDHLIKDPALGHLRGLVLTIVYISIVAPELIPKHVMADIVGGRVALLAGSKLSGNVLTYFTAMEVLSGYLDTEPMLIYGNLIQKVHSPLAGCATI
jgi:hypothetical protein